MKPYLITFLLVFLPLSYIQAQTVINPYTAKIDSIQQLLTKRPTDDTLRVIQLNDLAQVCFKDLQFKRGLLTAKEARALAKKLSFEKGEGLYFNTLRHFQIGSFLQFYYTYKEIWFYADRHKTVPKADIDFATPQNTDIEKKNKALFAALGYFEQSPDAEITANILRLISSNYLQSKRFDESMTYLDKSIKKFQEAKQPMTAYYSLADKIYFLENNGKIQEAKLAQQEIDKFTAASPDNREVALIYMGVSDFYYVKKDVTSAYAENSKANLLLERLGEKQLRISVLERLGNTFSYSLRLPNKALDFYMKEKTLAEGSVNKSELARIYHKVVFSLVQLKRFDEAQLYVEKAKKVIDNSPESDSKKTDLAQHYDALGQIFMGKQKYQEAIINFNQAIKIDSSRGGSSLAFYIDMYIAQCYQKMGHLKESINYGLRSYEEASKANTGDGRFVSHKVCLVLSENYDSFNKPIEAYKYLKIRQKYQKEIEDQDVANRLAEMEIQSIILKGDREKNRLEQARLLKEKENQNQRWWLFSIAAALLTAVALTVILYRNNRHKQKANTLLHRQKEEIDHQRDKAENALTELKTTQQQLIQKEKLASLGELTAGIAHEIQNPLNFVNNFSEVSNELVNELREEEAAPKRDPELIGELLTDLSQNLQKIHHHGSRASRIVQGMLEHSRTDSGEKRPTDLNALADEYLKIAYQGLRTKDKSVSAGTPERDRFDCLLVTQFDPAVGQIELSPQEIGRVLLNLYNNAFYAVSQRQKQRDGHDYKPRVEVRTQREGQHVVIQVTDNGTGIAESVKVKIFQPFFTTKPTGEGTGLGLSLSYDIVTKGHGGTLRVESQAGEGATFFIELPQRQKSDSHA